MSLMMAAMAAMAAMAVWGGRQASVASAARTTRLRAGVVKKVAMAVTAGTAVMEAVAAEVPVAQALLCMSLELRPRPLT